MAITYFIGKTYEPIVYPNDPQNCLRRVFKVVGYDDNDASVEFVHFHDFYDREEAESLLERVQGAAPDREHVANSHHWGTRARDTRSIEERFHDTAEWERNNQHLHC